ncbi:JlpA family lipoprotein adhesin [Campylobacter coli]|uniref:JlpA family lipoprotein adhesin n=1 Tax=Campylobacter coli TaxID=195 RepID=UPI000257E0E7|nr:JlpA family lipoprotein adhesin [Campylobacter coli]EIA96078.1 surface-exposed lipoprotein [Campylobacter coli LMG 23341]
MKKSIALTLGTIFFFSACSNSLDKTTVAKYEERLNTQINETLKDFQQDMGVTIEISNFSCKGDGMFLRCSSPNFNVFAKDNTQTEQKLIEAKNLEIYSNEIYTGEEQGLISLKDYYDNLLSKNKNLKTSFTLEGFKLGEKVISDINASLSQSDPKIQDYLAKLSSGVFTLSFENSLFVKNSDYNNNFNMKINNQDLNFDMNLNFDYKQSLLDFFEKAGIKYNTQTYAIDEKAVEELLDQQGFAQPIQESVILNNFKINSSLDTQGVFENYITIAKGGLEALKIQSQNEEQTLLIDKALLALNEITKDEVYKLDLEAKFKPIALSDYPKEGINAVEKLTVNNQDFTETLRILFGFMMIPIMLGDATGF